MSAQSNPVVSVVLPFLNGERWLRQALDSLQAQDFSDFEVIAIDDGSTDSSVSLVERAANQGLRIRLLHNGTNLGIVASLNRGLDAASGGFIARMDADDVCVRSRFARQLAFLTETGCDACGSWFVEFGQGPPRAVRWPSSEAALRAAMLFQNTICHPTLMARREVFERFRYREEYRLSEDYDLFARAMSHFRMANVAEPLLRYRRHPAQTTQARRDAMEAIAEKIRLEALSAAGITASSDEQSIHNMIRAPRSIYKLVDLLGIESWLKKLVAIHPDPEAQRVIASQWIRACVRAAPLGMRMLRTYRASSLPKIAVASARVTIDLAMLAAMRLDYRSPTFATLHRLGLSA
jgi:Glycosyl transferase family 2